MFYPLKFKPVYKDYLWGGRRLAEFGKQLPEEGNVAESWELSCHPNGPSVVSDGQFEGQTLADLIKIYPDELLGKAIDQRDRDKFPLLIKLIDAKQTLSVQVHPTDAYAHEHENGEYGKNEMWYVVSAPEGAELIAGVVRGTDKAELAKAIEEGRCEEVLQHIPVSEGDVINIPAGLVHAITDGLMIYEVQQNSDTTYRLYDYNRRGADGKLRDLHIDKALDVIDFTNAGGQVRFRGLTLPKTDSDPLERRMLVVNRYFAVEEYKLDGEASFDADGQAFRILTALDGDAVIRYADDLEVLLRRGETVFIPAALGEWTLVGNKAKIIASYLPDLRLLWPKLKQAAGAGQLDSTVGLRPYAPGITRSL